MITKNTFNRTELHSSPFFQNQERTVGQALEEMVHTLDYTDFYLGAWVEGIRLADDISVVEVGWNGNAGEKWIDTYEGPRDEIGPLAQLCYWFYKTTGKASGAVKAELLRVEHARGAKPIQLSTSRAGLYRPLHGGRWPEPELALVA